MSKIERVHAREILDSRGFPDRRGDGRRWRAARSGRPPCRRARRPASARRSSCATATAQRYMRQGRARRRSRNVRHRHRARRSSAWTRRPGGRRPEADRARRDAEQGERSARTRSSAVSLATARAAAATPSSRSIARSVARGAHVLPVPLMNVINGGAHADNPPRLPGVHDRAARRAVVRRGACARASRCITRCAGCSARRKLTTAVGDEGGFAPALALARGGARPARRGRSRAPGYGPARDVAIALDVAASELWRRGRLRDAQGRRQRGSAPTQMVELLAELVRRRIPIVSIEDGLGENDWDGWKQLTARLGKTRAAGRRRRLRHQRGDSRAAASPKASATPSSSR